jgi:hypothetical protein
MSEKPVVEIPVTRVSKIIASSDPAEGAIIGLVTDADADIRLVLSPVALAELEALLTRAAKEQAKKQPKQ